MEESPAKSSVLKAGIFRTSFPKDPLALKPSGTQERPTTASPQPPKAKNRNSALIEKLQANLVLSPPSLLLPVPSPEGKLHPRPPSASPPGSPPHSPSRENPPASFERPAEGAVLPSFNKGRARLSVKRRPPTRQHRKSYIEEQSAELGTSTFQPSGQEEEVPGTSLEGSHQTPKASIADTKIEEDSPGAQGEDSVCPTDSAMKDVLVPDDDWEKIPAEIHSACTHDSELTQSPGESAEQTQNQPWSLGD